MMKNTKELYKIKDARGIALLDLDEDVGTTCGQLAELLIAASALNQGTLDLMIQRTGRQAGAKVTFIQNNSFHDAFFLKAIGMSFRFHGSPFSGLYDSL